MTPLYTFPPILRNLIVNSIVDRAFSPKKKKKMLFLYSAHISLKQRLKALYNIPPTDLVKPLPTQLPGKHTSSAATGART